MQKWFTIVSTHALRRWEGETAVALCGKSKVVTRPEDLLDELPAGNKSCESCLRIIVRAS